MLKRCICITCAVLFVAAAASYAQQGPSGHWEGSIPRGVDREVLSLDLSKNAKSEWVASMGVPAYNVTGRVVQSITVKGASVTFFAVEMMAAFDLTLGADGIMKGKMTMDQGPTMSVEFKRTGEARVELMPLSPAVSTDLEGDWESTQKGPGGLAAIPIIFHFRNQPDKTVSAAMDIFTKNAMSFPLSNVKQTGRNVEFDFQLTHASFKGTLNREGTELSGQFSQEEDAVQLTLHKRTAEAAAEIADNPFAGTWKMNVEKSKFSDRPAPRSTTMTVHGIENGAFFVQEGVDAQGLNQAFRAVQRWDGKEGIGPSPNQTSLCSRLDRNTFVIVIKTDGKETRRTTEAVSNDGKTWNRTAKYKDARGNDQENIVIFEKQ